MRMNSKILNLGLIAVLGLTAACAAAYRIDYSQAVPELSASGSTKIAVATHDQREYVMSGKKHENFVGIVRGGYGNPFNLSTKSGKTLAEDFSGVIADGLSQKGFKATAVDVSSSDTPSGVIQKMKAEGADRMILLTLHEWKTDTYMAATLSYNISVKVMDGAGKTLAEKKAEGSEHLGTSAMNPAGVARKRAPEAFKEKIAEILNNPEIAKELR